MEKEKLWVKKSGGGCEVSFECTKCFAEVQSEYQHIAVYDTIMVGRMLMLDDIVQLTEYDEFAYQEMMSHTALFVHPCPKKVLIIGGGDGGVAREVARHKGVERIDLCEIDEKVIELCRKYIPSVACGFDDSRVNIHICDGAAFIKEHKNEYDVIIIDSSDPEGPAEPLFNENFYRSVYEALTDDGVMISQAESVYLLPEIVQRVTGYAKKIFPYSGYGMIAVPTYPTGTIGCCLGSKNNPIEKPCREIEKELADKLRYYTEKVHEGAFMLPAFAQRMLNKR